MNRSEVALAERLLAHARHSLKEHDLPCIARCLAMLSSQDTWWRPHGASNSVGNLILHLNGNVRQWIVAGLGGAPDRRERDKEFAARGPLPRRKLLAQLTATVGAACRVISRLTPADLTRPRTIQGYHVIGLEALVHVTEHFAYHTGQIILITKMRRRKDLGFTWLPGEKPHRQRGARLPTI
jgi:uncharacterized damage-inducible protein DinB